MYARHYQHWCSLDSWYHIAKEKIDCIMRFSQASVTFLQRTLFKSFPNFAIFWGNFKESLIWPSGNLLFAKMLRASRTWTIVVLMFVSLLNKSSMGTKLKNAQMMTNENMFNVFCYGIISRQSFFSPFQKSQKISFLIPMKKNSLWKRSKNWHLWEFSAMFFSLGTFL